MKKLMLIAALVIALIIPQAGLAKELTYTFQWTPNAEVMAQYVLYHRVDGQGYDYLIPTKVFPCAMAGGKCLTPDAVGDVCEGTATVNVEEGTVVTSYFVLRAEDAGQSQSGDSNEVFNTVDLAPIVPPVIQAAAHNEVTDTVDIAFQQTDFDRVEYWDLFMSQITGGPYNKVDTIQKTGTGDTFTASWPITQDGTYYFTLVAFTPEAIFSSDSNEMSVQVKTHPSPTKDFKIKIRIQ